MRLYLLQVDLGVKKGFFDVSAAECQILHFDLENDWGQVMLLSLKCTLSKNSRDGKSGRFQNTNESFQDRPGVFGPGGGNPCGQG